MERLELITSKEYWVECIEFLNSNNNTDNAISMFIVDRIKEAVELGKK